MPFFLDVLLQFVPVSLSLFFRQIIHSKMLITTQQFVDKNNNNKNTISCTSNNGLSSPPSSNCPIDLTFLCAELAYTHIEQCVSLYNTGLYDDLLLLRHLNNNTINGRRPPSGAFHTAKSLPTKFVTTTKQWTKKRRTFGSKASQNVPSISKITSAPYHQPYAATVLRQIRPAKELQPLPLKYFVGITHSGHSVTPFHANCWAKHNGCEDVVAQHNPKDYHGLLPPMTLCFEPLQRVERAQELETHPLRAHCHRSVQQKASLVEKRGEAAAPALSATRFRAILHLKTMAGCRPNNGYPPPMSVYNGPYELLRPAEQLTKSDIEAMISRHLLESVTSDENNCSNNNIVVDDGANVRHKSKKAAKIVVTTKPTSAHHGDEATDSNRNKQLLIMPITTIVNELRPADELLAVPIDLLCIIDKQPQQKEETTTTTEKRMSEKKLTMKITVTSSEMTKSTVAKSLPDSKEEALDNGGQTPLQLLKREEELECRPIGKFIASTNKQDEDGHGQQKTVTNGKKYTAKIVFKSIEKHKKTNAEKAEEKKVDGTKLHLICREDELECRPIGEFVTKATKSDNKQAKVVHGGQKATNGTKYTAKIIMKTVSVPQTTQLHELHLFDREDELQCRPIGEFVASVNKRARHVGNAEQKSKNEKKYTAKISIKVPKEQIGHQRNEVELEKDDHQQQQMQSLQLSKELKHQPIGESVTDASALAQNGDKSNKEQVEDVQCKGFASVVDEGKRMSRKRKRPSANTTLLQGFWQQIGTAPKDKKTKKGKKKKKSKKPDHDEKKGKKQKATTATTTTMSASSSSSSSSSSSDAETEEIHVLVHDEAKQQQMAEKTAVDSANLRGALNDQLPDGSVLSPQSPIATTVRTWHEQSSGPQRITTEVDEHGNMIRRVVTTEHVRHTVQTHSYQTVSSEQDGSNNTANAPILLAPGSTNNVMMATGTVSPPPILHKSPPPVPPARRRSSTVTTPQAAQMGGEIGGEQAAITGQEKNHVTFENGTFANGQPSPAAVEAIGELVSTKVVTTGNRTIETLTYKKEQDGMVETRVEHRITIHSNEDIDHDAELDRAISEATKMNPQMKVEKVEVERSSAP